MLASADPAAKTRTPREQLSDGRSAVSGSRLIRSEWTARTPRLLSAPQPPESQLLVLTPSSAMAAPAAKRAFYAIVFRQPRPVADIDVDV